MQRLVITVLAFAAGLAVTPLVHLTIPPAEAGNAMGPARMIMSSPDMRMQSAMNRMNLTMKSMKMSGNTDRDFMIMMIPHHQSAIDMARIELQYGRKPELKAMARDIIASQSKEISRMHIWLQQWFGV